MAREIEEERQRVHWLFINECARKIHRLVRKLALVKVTIAWTLITPLLSPLPFTHHYTHFTYSPCYISSFRSYHCRKRPMRFLSPSPLTLLSLSPTITHLLHTPFYISPFTQVTALSKKAFAARRRAVMSRCSLKYTAPPPSNHPLVATSTAGATMMGGGSSAIGGASIGGIGSPASSALGGDYSPPFLSSHSPVSSARTGSYSTNQSVHQSVNQSIHPSPQRISKISAALTANQTHLVTAALAAILQHNGETRYHPPGVNQTTPQFLRALEQTTLLCGPRFTAIDCMMLSAVLRNYACKVTHLRKYCIIHPIHTSPQTHSLLPLLTHAFIHPLTHPLNHPLTL